MNPYQHGRAAWEAAERLSDNPYVPLSPEWNDWKHGWIDANEDEHDRQNRQA
jgi:hypothetical protein